MKMTIAEAWPKLREGKMVKVVRDEPTLYGFKTLTGKVEFIRGEIMCVENKHRGVLLREEFRDTYLVFLKRKAIKQRSNKKYR